MKRCWIYCGVKPHTSLAEMGLRRDDLKNMLMIKDIRLYPSHQKICMELSFNAKEHLMF